MIDINIPPIILVGGSSGSAGWYVFWGAVAGGFASVLAQGVAAYLQHKNQVRRDADKLAQERAVRWDDRIRDVAARYIGATFTAIQTSMSVDKIIDAIRQRTIPQQSDEAMGAMFSAETAKRVSDRRIAIQEAGEPARRTQSEASALLAELLMIAPPEVRAAAKDLWSMTLELLSTATNKTLTESQREYELARGRLITSVAAVLRPELPTKKSAADAGSSSTEQGS